MLSKAFIFILATCTLVAPAQPVLTNCAQVAEAALRKGARAEFDLTARITHVADRGGKRRVAAWDGVAAFMFDETDSRRPHLRPGCTCRLKGRLVRNKFDEPDIAVSAIDDIVPGPVPKPTDISADDLKSGKYDSWLVRLKGVVRDVFRDDIDPHYRFLVLASGNRIVYVNQHVSAVESCAPNELFGATVSVVGLCRPNLHGLLRKTERRIERQIASAADGISIVQPAQANDLDIPDLGTIAYRQPEDIPLDQRYRACGRVLAVWHGDSLLLRLAEGPVVRVNLHATALPAVGDTVEAIGFPESNLFTLGFVGAIWRPHAPIDIPEPAVTNVTVRYLLEDGKGHPEIKVRLHGCPVHIEGLVHSARGEGLDSRLVLSSDGYNISVDPGPNPETLSDIPVGSRIAVTGTCLMDIDDWRRSAPFPRVRGFSVVLRSADDVRILARPDWWTPTRLAILLFSVLAVLFGSTLLNVLLKRLVERRSRQIEKEVGARIATECKVQERTRLAVEIHDAISQNLTGLAFQLQAVRNSAGRLPESAAKHLDVAERTLGSCRDELRNCLWDLRNNALECTDMNEAIRQTLAPHLGDARLSVRFDVARARFTDNFTHALLHVIRELTANAVRHGHASHVRVAGCIDNGRLAFSVTDDGTGFDAEHCPGFEDGHFGLMGVRERIEGFEGDLTVESGARGTKVTASMTLSDENGLRQQL